MEAIPGDPRFQIADGRAGRGSRRWLHISLRLRRQWLGTEAISPTGGSAICQAGAGRQAGESYQSGGARKRSQGLPAPAGRLRHSAHCAKSVARGLSRLRKSSKRLVHYRKPSLGPLMSSPGSEFSPRCWPATSISCGVPPPFASIRAPRFERARVGDSISVFNVWWPIGACARSVVGQSRRSWSRDGRNTRWRGNRPLPTRTQRTHRFRRLR